MNNAQKILQEVLGVSQLQEQPKNSIQGILQTKDYDQFVILSDTGDELHRFQGAKLANRCLPGDHVQLSADSEKVHLELRDEHPLIVGTLELTNKSKYGLTSKGIPIYLFTPYNRHYPHFIVGCSEKDVSKNRIILIKFDKWDSTFPRGLLHHTLGVSGDLDAEREALIWQASPLKWPKYDFKPAANGQSIGTRTPITGFTFNIDPAGCRDIDDVITFEKYGDLWKVIITIADVDVYVQDGDAVDIQASLISQTLYDNTGKVLRPMLPPQYSEGVCSLSPNKESYGLSLGFFWDGNSILDKHFFESTVKTDVSYVYEEFEASDSPYKKPLSEIAAYLDESNSGVVIDAHKWIERMMVFYNMEVGKLLKGAGKGILRRHSAPNLEKLEKYKALGSQDLEKLAFSSAEYCLADEAETKHYGLNTNTYAHASSPIRRYADLVNQRVLKGLLRGAKGGTYHTYIVPQAMYDMNFRGKAIKNFGRDLHFLEAILSGQSTFSGVILELVIKDENTKVKIYVPSWKRTISTRYKTAGENRVLSRDEKDEIDVSPFRQIQIRFALSPNSRCWKERIIINIS